MGLCISRKPGEIITFRAPWMADAAVVTLVRVVYRVENYTFAVFDYKGQQHYLQAGDAFQIPGVGIVATRIEPQRVRIQINASPEVVIFRGEVAK